jgi:hypothetical protein
MATLIASGIVITIRIGQSAGKISKHRYDKMYDIPSTTARVSVENDGLINQILLKVQSILHGNMK